MYVKESCAYELLRALGYHILIGHMILPIVPALLRVHASPMPALLIALMARKECIPPTVARTSTVSSCQIVSLVCAEDLENWIMR